MREDAEGRERALVERLRGGDPEAFEELVRTYQHRVFGIAVRMLGDASEAEDVAQEAFVRAHRALPGFRGEARLSTWLHAIVSRLCLNRLASGERRLRMPDAGLIARRADPRPDATEDLERGELEAALARAIGELPEDRRVVVLLRDVEGFSYDEIATALGLEPGTVRSRLHRARMDLKAKLERFFG